MHSASRRLPPLLSVAVVARTKKKWMQRLVAVVRDLIVADQVMLMLMAMCAVMLVLMSTAEFCGHNPSRQVQTPERGGSMMMPTISSIGLRLLF